jgi:pyruvate/2-oxoglutarate/acetoin dehydrogenase E1 component
MRLITYEQASMETIQEEFRRNPKIIHMSTDIPLDLQKEFGTDRVRGTPISESVFVGAAIGLSGSGFRAIVNILRFCGHGPDG